MSMKVFTPDETAKITQVINDGIKVKQEVKDLSEGLRDTVKAVAEEMEIKPAVLKKIKKAIGKEGDRIVKQSNIGFCEFFWFKCAGARTCDAWVGGGPIK